MQLHYVITFGNELGLFSIDATTGVIRTTSQLDYEGGQTYFVLQIAIYDQPAPGRVRTSRPQAATANVAINVTAVNEQPAVAPNTYWTLASAPVGYFVGRARSGDVDTIGYFDPLVEEWVYEPRSVDAHDGRSHTWRIVTQGVPFVIDPVTGVLSAAGELTEEQYTFEIEVTDGGGLTDTGQVTIVVEPVFKYLHAGEATPVGSVLGRVPFPQPNDGSATYRLEDDHAGRYAIDPVTGEIRLLQPLPYRFGEADVLDVMIGDRRGGEASYVIAVGDPDETNHVEAVIPATFDPNYLDPALVDSLVGETHTILPDGFILIEGWPGAPGGLTKFVKDGMVAVVKTDLLGPTKVAHTVYEFVRYAAPYTMWPGLMPPVTEGYLLAGQIVVHPSYTAKTAADTIVFSPNEVETAQFNQFLIGLLPGAGTALAITDERWVDAAVNGVADVLFMYSVAGRLATTFASGLARGSFYAAHAARVHQLHAMAEFTAAAWDSRLAINAYRQGEYDEAAFLAGVTTLRLMGAALDARQIGSLRELAKSGQVAVRSTRNAAGELVLKFRRTLKSPQTGLYERLISTADETAGDLAQRALQYRRLLVTNGTLSKFTDAKANIAVVEYWDGSNYHFIEAVSERGINGRHAEKVLLDELAARGVDPKQVTRLFTERQPCDKAGFECARILREAFGDNPVEVTYFVPFRPFEEAKLAASRLKSLLRGIE